MSDEEDVPLVIDQSSTDGTKQPTEKEEQMETESSPEQSAPLKPSDPEPEGSSSELQEEKPELMDHSPSSLTLKTDTEQPVAGSGTSGVLSNSQGSPKIVQPNENCTSASVSEAISHRKESSQMDLTTKSSSTSPKKKTDSIMEDPMPTEDMMPGSPVPMEDSHIEDTTLKTADVENNTSLCSPGNVSAISCIDTPVGSPSDNPAPPSSMSGGTSTSTPAGTSATSTTATTTSKTVTTPPATLENNVTNTPVISSTTTTPVTTPVTSVITPAATPTTAPSSMPAATPTTAPSSTPAATPTTAPSSTSAATPTTAPSSTPAAISTETPNVDGTPRSRVTRSRNPDFAAKQKSFMKEYHRSVSGSGAVSDSTQDASRAEKRPASDDLAPAAKRSRKLSRGSEESPPNTAVGAGVLNDNFCWVCHREGQVVCCETCPRVFHLKCAHLASDPAGDWVCSECRRVVQAESAERRLSADRLQQLTKYAIGRLKGLPGAEPFLQPVDERKFPTYREYVGCPMDLATMEQNVERGRYGSTEAFVADCKWILHNCILFNGTASKLTALAKSLLRMCKWEMEEMETCPDCYGNAYVSDNWFTLACPHPHLLIWARLKGFPFWPAKAVKTRDGNVDCRFFGRHDRAWVPAKECFLFSREPPTPPKNRTKSLDACVEELEEHVKNLEKRFGKYIFAKPRTKYDPKNLEAQLSMALPGYRGRDAALSPERAGVKRSNSEVQLAILDRLRRDKKARQTGGGEPVGPDSSPPAEPAEPAADGTNTGTSCHGSPADRGHQRAERPARTESRDSDKAESTKTDAASTDSGSSGSDELETAKAGTVKPETAKVGVVKPETGKAGTANVDTVKSGAAKIGTAKHDAAKTDTVKSGTAKTDSVKSGTSKPDAVKTVTVKTETTKTDAGKTETVKSATDKTDTPEVPVAKTGEPGKATKAKSEPSKVKVVVVKTEVVDRPAVTRRSESDATSEEEEPRPRRRTARKSLSAAATAAVSSSAPTSSSSAIVPAGGTTKVYCRPPSKPSGGSVGTGPQATRPPAKPSSAPAAKTRPHAATVTTVAGSKAARTVTVTKSGATAAVQVCRMTSQTKVNSVTNNGVSQQVLTAPLRPKLLTTSTGGGGASRPPAPVTSAAPQQSIIVNRGNARLMIPRAQLNQLYIPTGSPAGTITSSMMVIPGGLGTATNGTAAAAVVTYPAGNSAVAAGVAGAAPVPPAAPAEAGPVSALVEGQAQQLTEMMRRGVERMLSDLSAVGPDSSAATVTRLRLQLERMEWQHRAELAELKKASDLKDAQMAELKAAMERDQKKAAAKLTSTVAAEYKTWERMMETRIAETKKKQWCANCGKEAIFYCCWNTSYCDFPCQEAQWPKHMLTCANQQGNNAATADGAGGGGDDSDAGRLQQTV